VYLTILALRQMVRPVPGERPSAVLRIVAILVLGTCAGLPIWVMVMILLG
jgi:hypothetical protein